MLDKITENMLKETPKQNLQNQLQAAYNQIISAKIANKIALVRFGMSEEDARRFVDEIDEAIFLEMSGTYSKAEKAFKAMMEES